MAEQKVLITAESLNEKLATPGWAVVDCRFVLTDPDAGRQSYESGHIPGAIFMDLDKDLAGPVGPETGRHPLPDVERICETLGQLGIANTDSIVVYDGGNGALAARAWWILRWLGHDAVYVLNGGFAAWQACGLPVELTEPEVSAARFEGRPRDDCILTTEEVTADLAASGGLMLLDARDAARFNGEAEPIDAVAGHIPGSINLPFTEFVQEDGTWLPLEQRCKRLETILGPDRNVSWAVMCGSGVTACHLAISGIEAGFRLPRLYVGSWSEWIRDPARPIGGEGS